jgi:pilus assembly protein CpaB
MRTALLFLCAVVAAGLAAFLAQSWLAGQREALMAAVASRPQAAAPAALPMVLVAKADLRPGQFVQPEHLRWQAWPAEALSPAHAVQGKRSEADFAGAVARTPILAGEPVTDARLVKPGDRGFLAAVLEPGMRAVTVPTSATSGIAGFAFPGDRVDLILTSQMAEDGQGGPKFAATVLESVRVLAIDQRLGPQGAEAVPGKTATIEVTPKMAEKVALALQMGGLTLSLRGLGSDGGQPPAPVEPVPDPTLASELYAGFPAPSAAPPPPEGKERPRVLLLRGAEASEVKF